MLEELKKYENLGTPSYFWILLNQLKNGESWTEKNIESYFFNKIIDDKSIFDGCLPLLKLSKIISIEEDSKNIKVNFLYKHILDNSDICKQKLLEGFLLSLCKDENFYSIFSSKNTSYDIIYKSIQIKYYAFGLAYSNIRKLLIDFNFLIPHPDFPEKKLLINNNWKDFFDSNFIHEIRKRKIGIEELKKILEQQAINGEIAEKFVLKFEGKRLNNKIGIEWLAPFDTGAGYDILSFNTFQSKTSDRFIEVKSYVGLNPSFYWSNNEFKTAKKYNTNYFLYLVDRDKINLAGYEPIIISNPYINVLENEKWIKEADKYYIYLNNNIKNFK